jgi:hypothetical protein
VQVLEYDRELEVLEQHHCMVGEGSLVELEPIPIERHIQCSGSSWQDRARIEDVRGSGSSDGGANREEGGWVRGSGAGGGGRDGASIGTAAQSGST